MQIAPPLPPNDPASAPALNSLQEDDEIDFRRIWEIIVAFKKTIALVTILCVSLATVLAFILPPKYQATVLITPADDGRGAGGIGALAGQFGGLAEMAGINLQGGGNKEAAIAYMKSRVFIENFIKEKDLLPVLFAKKWNAGAKKWNVENEEEIPTLWDAYQFFSKKILSVNPDKKTGLITVSVEWKDREMAVNWANEIVKKANEHLRQRAIAEAELSIGYLEKELQKTSVIEVQQAVFKVMESQIKSKMIANVQEQFAFKVIDPAALMSENAYVQPKRPLIIGVGLLGGLMCGLLVAFIRNLMSPRNRSQNGQAIPL
jgi:uncharacterized protein involved in exopolysaccharide biosynthesis